MTGWTRGKRGERGKEGSQREKRLCATGAADVKAWGVWSEQFRQAEDKRCRRARPMFTRGNGECAVCNALRGSERGETDEGTCPSSEAMIME